MNGEDKRRRPSPGGRTPGSPEPAPEPAKDAATRPVKTEDAKDGEPPEEIGGPTGPEPTRFGDWERGGRCSDF